jgi:hypothetical protein
VTKVAKKVKVRDKEEKDMCLEPVEQLNTRKWQEYLQVRLSKVVKRPWHWGKDLDTSVCPLKAGDDGYIFL